MNMRKQSLSGLAASIAMLGQILAIQSMPVRSSPLRPRDPEVPEEFHDTKKWKKPVQEVPPVYPGEILNVLARYKIESFNSGPSRLNTQKRMGSIPPTWRPGKSGSNRRRW